MAHLSALFTLLAISPLVPAQTVVRVGARPAPVAGPMAPIAPPVFAAGGYAATGCGPYAAAMSGDPVPGGGSLALTAFMDPAPCAASGRIAFFSQVAGSARNQGIFVADSWGLHPVVFGSGGGGGSGAPGAAGDPSPIGGTFAGFFNGTFFAPAINDAGDVLFLADVYQGSAPRGLFLRKGATGAFAKVAAVGDPSPAGGTITAVGPGSLNDLGEVVFVAQRTGGAVDLLRSSGGVLSKVAAVGDPGPGGSAYQILVGESLGFVDGSTIPVGPIPAINHAGNVCFRAILANGSRGLVLKTSLGIQWYVRSGNVAPGGGTYFDFQAASLNNANQIAFFADVLLSPGNYTSGWYAGKPGAWRKALAFYDSVGGGQCYGLAFSRNPISTIDDAGNVILWATVQFAGGNPSERILLSTAAGALQDVAVQGSPSPTGAPYGIFDAWPSISSAGALSWGSGSPNARFVAPVCAFLGAAPYGTGTPGCLGAHELSASSAPKVGNFLFEVECNHAPASALGLLLVSDQQDFAGSDSLGLGVLFHVGFFGAFLLGADMPSDAAGHGETPLPIPNDPLLAGQAYFAQGVWLWPAGSGCAPSPLQLSSSAGLWIQIQS